MPQSRREYQGLVEASAYAAVGEPLRVAITILSDLSALCISAVVAYLAWASPVRGQSVGLYLQLAPLLSVFVATYYLLGVYPGQGLGGVELLRRLSLGTLLCFAFLAAATFALKIPPRYSRVTFGLTIVLSLVLVPLFRLATLKLVRRSRWWSKPVVLVTSSLRDESSKVLLTRSLHSGYRAVGVLVADVRQIDECVVDLPVLGSLANAPEVARLGIHTAIVGASDLDLTELLEHLRHDFRHVLSISSYSDVGVERVQVRSLGDLLGLEYTNNLLIPRNRVSKRSLDILLGVPLLLVSLPVIVGAIAMVRLRGPGTGLFFQERGGHEGRVFRMPKIRTMIPDAEVNLGERLTTDPEFTNQWSERFKLNDDPRIIPGVGSFLRRFSIDELPQLWSVLAGDMSLVGPRPLPEYHLEALSEDARRVREEVRPGITGLWQIRDRGTLDIAEQEARDTYYVQNWTVWLDLYILGRTVEAVLMGRGAS